LKILWCESILYTKLYRFNIMMATQRSFGWQCRDNLHRIYIYTYREISRESIQSMCELLVIVAWNTFWVALLPFFNKLIAFHLSLVWTRCAGPDTVLITEAYYNRIWEGIKRIVHHCPDRSGAPSEAERNASFHSNTTKTKIYLQLCYICPAVFFYLFIMFFKGTMCRICSCVNRALNASTVYEHDVI